MKFYKCNKSSKLFVCKHTCNVCEIKIAFCVSIEACNFLTTYSLTSYRYIIIYLHLKVSDFIQKI